MRIMKIDEGYAELVRRAVYGGKPRTVRRKKCRTLGGVTTTFSPLPNVPHGLGFNKKFAIAELISIVTGHNDVEWLAQFNPKIREFSDDGKTFHGHYGDRLQFQWQRLFERLAEDRYTRQAVFQIWDWGLDLEDSKDLPCNTMFQIIYNPDGRFDMVVFQRSSDLIWGLPYDHFVFGQLLQMICTELALPMGDVHRHIVDAHVYEAGEYYTQDRIDVAMKEVFWSDWSTDLGFVEFRLAAQQVIARTPLCPSAHAMMAELGLTK